MPSRPNPIAAINVVQVKNKLHPDNSVETTMEKIQSFPNTRLGKQAAHLTFAQWMRELFFTPPVIIDEAVEESIESAIDMGEYQFDGGALLLSESTCN